MKELNQLFDFLKLNKMVKSKIEFAEKLGYSRQHVTETLNGTRELTAEFQKKVNFHFGDVLDRINNQSVMLPSNVSLITPSIDAETFTNKFGNQFIPLEDGRYLMGSPIVPHYVKGGPMAGFGDAEYFDDLPKHYVVVDRLHRGKYLSFDMIGDSMDYDGRDYIANGARLTAREIKKELWVGSKLHLNQYKDFVIEHSEGLTIKRIIDHDTQRYTITCHSLNPDKEKHPDFILNLNEVHNLFNVIKVDNPR